MGTATRKRSARQAKTGPAAAKWKYLTAHFWASMAWSVVRGALIIGLCYIILYPIIVKFVSSIMSEADLFDYTVKWISRRLDWKSVTRNYADVYHAMKYPFFDVFGLLKTPLNLLGTFWPFILTSITGMGLKNGLYIYIMRQVFKGMPNSLEEAALVDGAGPVRTLFRIMMPNAGSAMLVVFLFSFVWQYNDLYLTEMYMRTSSTMLPFMLRNLATAFDSFDYTKEYMSIITNTGMIMFIMPILIIYGFLQRYFIESVERTEIVG